MLFPRSPSCCAGKSAVGLLSYLACAAQSLPVVYVPRAGDWVTAARAGNGDAFFLRTLLKQNAGECALDCSAAVFTLARFRNDDTPPTCTAARAPFLFSFPALQTLSWATSA